jgi:hypothetical protein
MFTLVNGLPPEILGVVISGKTTEADYDQLNPMLERHKMEHGELKLFIEIDELNYTAKALWEDLKTDLHYWNDMNAVAIVTDKEWLEKTAEAFGAILPNMKVKGFELSERQKAIDWLKSQK